MTAPSLLHPAVPVLLVDDEQQVLEITRFTLRSHGITNLATLNDGREVLSFLARQPVAAVVLDLMMPHLSGSDLLPRILDAHPHLPVIVMTALYDVEAAVHCMKVGAFDYLIKPVEASRLFSAVEKALRIGALTGEVASLKERLLSGTLEKAEAFEEIISCSPRIQALFRYAEVVARSREAILVTGETGVGKELFARAIHRASGMQGELVTLNIAGLDDTLLSDTLFGHARGAFTGAGTMREGLIARAAGGNLFLDEIGDLDEASQIKLLRLVQQGEYYPVGSDMLKKVDTRIIAATNHDLVALMEAGRFRRDLYYRLCAHQIQVPPLREHPEDIPLLLNHFLDEAAGAFNCARPRLLPEVAVYFSAYRFPGNVRELRALIFDAVARTGCGNLSLDCFPSLPTGAPVTDATILPIARDIQLLVQMFGRFPSIREMEDFLIGEAIRLTGGNQTAAAALLDISRPTLNKRLHRRDDE